MHGTEQRCSLLREVKDGHPLAAKGSSNVQEFIAGARWIYEGLELEVYYIEEKSEPAARPEQ